ncbi:MAG TPA: hypothetical protein PKL64_01925 [Bacteroidales bacterium]|nr:hypothetical protein [Bacteroidales bacterium]
MNKEQIKIVTQYLEIETNYAIIINGRYGVGKTFFYKNHLVPIIKDISLPKNERKKFIPIHISLFGIKCLEEIQTAIFVELFPILKHRGINLAAGICKSIIRGIAQINQTGDIDKYIGDLNLDADDWLKYDELVICFDDIDRKSDSLDLRDVFGFINSLVENQGAKILIIANEPQLIKDKNYTSSLREKVIGVSIPYIPNPQLIFEQIINERYSFAFKIYYDFLLEHKNEIVTIIEMNENNFRNLIFFLEHFKIVFDQIENLFQIEKDFAVRKTEKLKAILDFTLAISIEYKLGSLNFTNFDEIKNMNEYPNIIDLDKFLAKSNILTSKEQNEEPLYIAIFKNKYFSKNKFYFFKSIFKYITGTKAFNVDNLKVELENYFIIKNGEVPRYEKLLQELSFFDCLKLTDAEYRKYTTEMLFYLDQGIYQLRQYPTVFFFATRFNNVLNYNLDKLIKRFKKGIKKGKHNYSYNYDLSFEISVNNDNEFRNETLEIIKFCREINDSLKETNDKKELNNLFEIFLTDFNKFIERVSERDNEYYFSPFWLEFDIKKIHKRINKLDNQQIFRLAQYFISRYRRNIYEKLYPEKTFVQGLRLLIDNPTRSRRRKTLKNASLDFLSKKLIDSENNFPAEQYL